MPLVLKLTAIYIAINAAILLTLAFNVVLARWRTRTPILDRDKPEMVRAIRAHGNAAETIPIAAILLVMVYLLGGNIVPIHAMGLTLTLGRLLHAGALLRTTGPSWGRTGGMVLTAIAIAIGIVASLWLAFTAPP